MMESLTNELYEKGLGVINEVGNITTELLILSYSTMEGLKSILKPQYLRNGRA